MLSADAFVSCPNNGLITAYPRVSTADGFLSQHLLPLVVMNIVTFRGWFHFLDLQNLFLKALYVKTVKGPALLAFQLEDGAFSGVWNAHNQSVPCVQPDRPMAKKLGN